MRPFIRRLTTAIVLGLLGPAVARADAPQPAPPAASVPLAASGAPAASAPPTASAPAASSIPAALPPAGASVTGVGLGVVALAGATDSAWRLAQELYADPALRPESIDEAHARILCGEPPSPGADQDLRDLAETVAAVHGDDAPSRTLLDGIAHRFDLRGVVVVRPQVPHAAADEPGLPASARVFLGGTGVFDGATYAPDEAPAGAPATPMPWSAAVRSLDRTFGQVPSASPAAALATHEAPPEPTSSRHFYESAWFWGALGLAALAGGAVFFATRDSGSSTIHLEAQVPH